MKISFFEFEKQRIRGLLAKQLRPIFDGVRIKCTFDEWVDALVIQTLEWSIDVDFEVGQQVKHIGGRTGVVISDHDLLIHDYLDHLDDFDFDPKKPETVRVQWRDNTITDCRPDELEAQQ